MSDIEIVEEFIFDELAVRIQSAEPVPDTDEEDGIQGAKNARLALRRLTDQLSEITGQLKSASAEAAACIKFLQSELAWNDFRSEGFIGQEAVSASTRNCQRLAAFLKDRGNHGVRFLAAHEAILGPEIEAERARQVEQWGGNHHDDGHDRHDWIEFIESFTGKAYRVAQWGDKAVEFENRLIQVAALAIAAVQSSRRKRDALPRTVTATVVEGLDFRKEPDA